VIRTIKILTIFPEAFDSFLSTGLLKKAVEKNILDVERINIRDYTHDPHRSVDDTPYGGGAGMLMKVEPVVEALESAGPGRRVILTPRGRPFTQADARKLADGDSMILVCGRYEGFDERVYAFVDMEVSLGDFVLHGGEVAAMAVIESVVRLHPGFMGNEASLFEESHAAGLLEYPQYTRPPSFRDLDVPEVLVSGNHEKIRRWRRGRALAITRARRPDLFVRLELDEADLELLEEAEREMAAKKDPEP
jgi:tRNA (guanine37-N1)-methyltransferase